MAEHFLGVVKVNKVVIVNDHRFIHPDTEDICDVRPVTLSQLMRDAKKLENQDLYLYPQKGDMESKMFMVYYDKNIDK